MLRRSPSRRGILSASLALAAGGTLASGLTPRKARAAGEGRPEGLDKLRESEPRPVPEISFTDADGTPHGLAGFAGRGVVINLWATWCAPCVAEMPALDRMQAALEAEGIVVLALSSDRGGRAPVEAFYRRVGISRLGIWLDPRGAAQRALGVRGLPTSVILDREGRERARLEGAAAWDAPELMAEVRRLTGPAPG